MAHAADPASPLSPFGEPSREIREQEFAQFDRAMKETRTSVPSDLAPHIGRILWFYQMGLLLFWIYDRSDGQSRSRQLLEASLPVVLLLIKLSSVTLLKPARRRVLKILSVLEA
jgi:Tetracyclin repressor-like, C-terminal domain